MIEIERAEVEQWLTGSAEDAQALMRVPLVEAFEAGPVGAAPREG